MVGMRWNGVNSNAAREVEVVFDEPSSALPPLSNSRHAVNFDNANTLTPVTPRSGPWPMCGHRGVARRAGCLAYAARELRM